MIFPSTEVDVIFLARNYKNFESNNIRVIALPIDILAKVSDKYTVIESAIEHGFPVAEARLCSSLDGLRDAASQLATFPLILKGRSGMGSGYIWKASSWHDVESSWIKAQGLGLQEIILQKFVLGGRERSFNYLISRDGELQCAFALAKPHHAFPSQSTSIVVIPPPPEMEIGAEMLRSLGVTGFAAMQTIFDAEDGKHKIIEINGRLGSNSRILHGMGIDLATWMVKAARGDKELNFPSVTVGAAGISVHESLLAVRSYFSARKRTSATAPSVFEFAASYLRLLSTLPRVDINTRSAPIDLSGYRHYVGSVWRQFSGMRNSSALVDLIPWGDLNVS